MRALKIKFLIALSAILICSLFSQPAFADPEGSGSKSDSDPHGQSDKGKGYGEGYGHGEGHSHHFISHLLKHKDKLALTADQVSAIEKLRNDYQKQQTDVGAEHMAAHKELHKLAHAETIDEAGMHGVADRISAVKSKAIHAMVEAKIAALKILTSEQRKKMQALHEEMQKKMEGKHEEMKQKHGEKK